MSFGKRLTEARKKKGLTQEQLGKGLATDGQDASKSVVYGWEKDQHFPKVDQLVLICNKLGCSADYLLFGGSVAPALAPEIAAVAMQINNLPDTQRELILTVVRNFRSPAE
jgi:transcriptional regulator with XRE-family HTH domain